MSLPPPGVLFQVTCDYCRADITRTIRIRCAECSNVDLCLRCFSHGVEFLDHRNDHSYQLQDQVQEAVFTTNWGADEELRLLSGLERSGVDNWDVVARHVATGKTPRECEAHYECVYLSKLATSRDEPRLLSPEEEEHQRMAYRSVAESPVPFLGQYKLKKPKRSPAALLGYVWRRNELTYPFDPDAETAVCEFEFDPSHKSSELAHVREAKLRLLRRYAETQDRRDARLVFLRTRGFLADPMDPDETLGHLYQWEAEEADLPVVQIPGAAAAIQPEKLTGHKRSRSAADILSEPNRLRLTRAWERRRDTEAGFRPELRSKLATLFPYQQFVFHKLWSWLHGAEWRALVGEDAGGGVAGAVAGTAAAALDGSLRPPGAASPAVLQPSSSAAAPAAAAVPAASASASPSAWPSATTSSASGTGAKPEASSSTADNPGSGDSDDARPHRWTPEALLKLVVACRHLDRFTACAKQNLKLLQSFLVEEHLRARIAELQARRAQPGSGKDEGPPVGSGERSVLELDGAEHLTDTEADLCLQLDLPPPHYAFVKSRLLVQAAMDGGRLSRQRMYILFAGQLDPPVSPHSPPSAGAPEDRRISRFLLDRIFDCCAEQGWFVPVEQEPVVAPPPTLF